MDIRAYFGHGASQLESSSSDEHETNIHESGPPMKRVCADTVHHRLKSHPVSSSRKYNKKWEDNFPWLEFDEDCQGAFCKVCKKRGKSLERTGGAWITQPFTNWKKAVEKMKLHAQSNFHVESCKAEVEAEQATRRGSIIQQIQSVTEEERMKNRLAIKSLIRCTHFLVHEHIAHTTKFNKLVDLVSCGSQHLDVFMQNARRNATYTSTVAVAEFIEAIGVWIEGCVLKQVHDAPSTVSWQMSVLMFEELSICCRWVSNGVPVEHFIGILPLKKADAESVHLAIVDFLKSRGIQLSRLVGMGFDGAPIFSGKQTGVQARLKKLSPHAIYVHCHCHLLQLACVQAAKSISGIKHVYVTLTTLWKFFYHSPKCAESLKEVQNVLNLPELKIVKPSDTRWLAHERCVKAVKASYNAIVVTLDNIYEETGEPEALGISKALSKQSTVAAIYLLDYVLPQIAKLSRALQAKELDLSIISTIVDATITSLDDAILPAANWVLELLDAAEELEKTTDIKINSENISLFQDKVGKQFISLVKENISSCFSSSGDIVSAFSIFDPKKVPPSSDLLSTYGNDLVETLIQHYAKDFPAMTLEGKEFLKPAIISSELCTEWKTFRNLLTTQAKEDLQHQLKEIITNKTLATLLPNLHKVATICLAIPVGTASVERTFSQMKLVKNWLQNRMSEQTLSYLMRIAIESPEALSNENIEEIVDIWNKKKQKN